jgi:hypothetical protein
MTTKMKSFKGDIQTFLDKITGPEGLINRLNCKWVAPNIHRVVDTLCYNIVAPLFWFGFYMGLIGCMGCCMIPTTYYLREDFGSGSSWQAQKGGITTMGLNKVHPQTKGKKYQRKILPPVD